jgi:hypothetical protein
MIYDADNYNNNYQYKKLNFLFLHIPKCAGSSLRCILSDYFQQIYKEDEIFIPNANHNINFLSTYFQQICELYEYDKMKVVLAHCKYNDLKHMNVHSNYKITFLRDPIERIISHYYFFDYENTKTHLIDLQIDEFVKLCNYYGNVMCDWLGLLDLNDELIEHLIPERINEFDFIGCVETFKQDITTLNQLLNDWFGISYELDIHIVENKNNNNIQKTDLTELYEKIKPFVININDYKLYKYVIMSKSNNNLV